MTSCDVGKMWPTCGLGLTLCKITEMALGEEVKSLSLYREKHILFHGYVFPFIALYVAVVVGWTTTQEEWLAHAEPLYITLAAIAAANVVTCLFCVWSVHVRCALSLKRVRVAELYIKIFKHVMCRLCLQKMLHLSKLCRHPTMVQLNWFT